MEQESNTLVSALDGYLKCISRLCANNYAFAASCYKANNDIDTFCRKFASFINAGDKYTKPSKHEYLGYKEIDSKKLFEIIEEYVFNGLLDLERMTNEKARYYTKKTLIEDINEYYGLISVSKNRDGEFHPLLSGGVYQINIKCEKYAKSFYFIKKIEDIYVLACFLQKVPVEQ
jgi:hypothetical protein